MEVKITNIKRTPRIAKSSGKPFVSVGIQTEQHGAKWLSGFANVDNADWEIGSVAQIDVEQNGDFLNFTTPKKEYDRGPAAQHPATQELKNMLTLQVIPLLMQIDANVKKLTGASKNDYPAPNNDDVPF